MSRSLLEDPPVTIFPPTNRIDPLALGCAAAAMIALELLRRANAVPAEIEFTRPCCDQDRFARLAARH